MSAINYRLRPAKNIERKMLAEAFQRLGAFHDVDKYRYIGFGAYFFRDFVLLHRTLNITNMLSIEKNDSNMERFEFNKPFACIEIDFRHSNEALPDLEWTIPTIMWLDYECRLNREVLKDVDLLSYHMIAGSVAVVTVNAYAGHPHQQNAYDLLTDDIGAENIPWGYDQDTLRGWGRAAASRDIIDERIREALKQRNAGKPRGERIKYQQLFHFRYSDSSKMVTVGGIFMTEDQRDTLDKCLFGELPFIRHDKEPFMIDTPTLTTREIQYLNSQIPCDNPSGVTLPRGISEEAFRKYLSVYRYYPRFAEVDQ